MYTRTPRLLHVTDRSESRVALGAVFREEGCDVHLAGDSDEGLEKAASLPFDLAIVDGHLSGAEQFCQCLKSHSAARTIPVLIYSGSCGPERVLPPLPEGLDGYLVMPVNTDVLVAYVRTLLRLGEARARADETNLPAETFRRAYAVARVVAWSYDPRTDRMTRSDNAVDVHHRDPGTTGAEGWAMVHPEDLPRHQAAVYEALEKRRPYKSLFRSLTASGNILWLEDHGQGEWDSEGNLVRISGAVVDVTDRIRLEEQLRQSQKMEAIGRLAAGVAHDFNNLLTIINGYADFIVRQGTNEYREFAREIAQAGRRAAALTQQLLAFSRKQVLTPETLDLNAVIRELEKILRRVIGEDIDLKSDLGAALGLVEADRTQLEQVIINLAANARDAMPDGGELIIRTRNTSADFGPAVVLTVSDNGLGMSREVQSHIFEPFYTTKDVGRGTGLGLAMAQGIVQQSGGRIDVQSEVGAGTTFSILLPITSQNQKKTKSNPKPATPRGNERVMLVEDEDRVRAFARHVLADGGYQVVEAANGQEAIEVMKAQTRKIDLVISDVVMPAMGGTALAEQIKVLSPRTKVLYVSGYTNDEIVRRGISNDDVAFLAKPFTPIELLEKVRIVLDTR